MQELTSTSQALRIAWRAAKAYRVDGTSSAALRAWRWPGFMLVHTLVVAAAAGDVVWEGVAAIMVPCRSRRRARMLPGGLLVVVVMAVLVVVFCLALVALVLAAMGLGASTPTWVKALAAVFVFLVLFLGPIAGPQVRPSRIREGCALRQWKRRLGRRGRTVVTAASAMKRGAFTALLLEVTAESRAAGQIVVGHARSEDIAAIYRARGARSHPRFPLLVVWF